MGCTAEQARRGPQAPIFRANWSLPVSPAKAIVQPLCIFAASRMSFDVIVRKLVLPTIAKGEIFDRLPLLDHGWCPSTTSITRNGTSADKWPIWRISRE